MAMFLPFLFSLEYIWTTIVLLFSFQWNALSQCGRGSEHVRRGPPAREDRSSDNRGCRLQLLWSNLVAAALHWDNGINEVGVVALLMAL